MTPRSTPDLTFPDLHRQPVAVAFDAPDIVSDTGLLTLRDLDHQLGYLADLARRLPDPRAQQFITHTTAQLLTQQVYQILADYPDCTMTPTASATTRCSRRWPAATPAATPRWPRAAPWRGSSTPSPDGNWSYPPRTGRPSATCTGPAVTARDSSTSSSSIPLSARAAGRPLSSSSTWTHPTTRPTAARRCRATTATTASTSTCRCWSSTATAASRWPPGCGRAPAMAPWGRWTSCGPSSRPCAGPGRRCWCWCAATAAWRCRPCT